MLWPTPFSLALQYCPVSCRDIRASQTIMPQSDRKRNRGVAPIRAARYHPTMSHIAYSDVFRTRREWLERVPGIRIAEDKLLLSAAVTWEPGDATHYCWTFWPMPANTCHAVRQVQGLGMAWAVTLWSPVYGPTVTSTCACIAGASGGAVASTEWLARELGCSSYTARVSAIAVNAYLASHQLDYAREQLERMRRMDRPEFVDPEGPIVVLDDPDNAPAELRG